MTGPGVGKVVIDVEVLFSGKPIKCDVYIHVKGYSRALVTHLDIEGFYVYADRKHIPAVIIGRRDGILIILSKPIVVDSMKVKRIEIKGLKILGVGKRSGAYLGVKDGGVFLGVKRDIIKKLEEIAREKEPELFRGGREPLDRFLE